MTQKADIVKGVVLIVTKIDSTYGPFQIDAMNLLRGAASPCVLGDELDVLSKPRKVDGVNVVRVKRRSDGREGEIYYHYARYNTVKK